MNSGSQHLLLESAFERRVNGLSLRFSNALPSLLLFRSRTSSAIAPMRGLAGHDRRWASDTIPTGTHSTNDFVEVTLDLHPDDTVVLRSVEPADRNSSGSSTPSMARSHSSRIRQFSQELKAEARRISHDIMAELKKFSRSHGHTPAASGFDSALAARALRRQRAELDRSRSGAHKALRGLKFISGRTNGVDGWNEVQTSFDKLAIDGFLSRLDFALCIGLISRAFSCPNFIIKH